MNSKNNIAPRIVALMLFLLGLKLLYFETINVRGINIETNLITDVMAIILMFFSLYIIYYYKR